MITQALLIFVCQFVLIFLLGTQSQHVRDGKKLASAITSLLLGVAGWTITGIVSTAYVSGMFSLVFFSFIIAGPCGIVCSIMAHQYFRKEK